MKKPFLFVIIYLLIASSSLFGVKRFGVLQWSPEQVNSHLGNLSKENQALFLATTGEEVQDALAQGADINATFTTKFGDTFNAMDLLLTYAPSSTNPNKNLKWEEATLDKQFYSKLFNASEREVVTNRMMLNMLEVLIKNGIDVKYPTKPQRIALLVEGEDTVSEKSLSSLDFLYEQIPANERLAFIKGLKNVPNYTYYLIMALRNNDSKVVDYILEQMNETPLYALKWMALNNTISITLVPYLLYRLNSETQDLDFISGHPSQTELAKDLSDIYDRAKSEKNKAFVKAMLDYYTLLKKYGNSSKVPPEIMRQSFSFLGPEDLSDIVSKQESKKSLKKK